MQITTGGTICKNARMSSWMPISGTGAFEVAMLGMHPKEVTDRRK